MLTAVHLSQFHPKHPFLHASTALSRKFSSTVGEPYQQHYTCWTYSILSRHREKPATSSGCLERHHPQMLVARSKQKIPFGMPLKLALRRNKTHTARRGQLKHDVVDFVSSYVKRLFAGIEFYRLH